MGVKTIVPTGMPRALPSDPLGSQHCGKKHCYQHRSHSHQSYAQDGQIGLQGVPIASCTRPFGVFEHSVIGVTK